MGVNVPTGNGVGPPARLRPGDAPLAGPVEGPVAPAGGRPGRRLGLASRLAPVQPPRRDAQGFCDRRAAAEMHAEACDLAELWLYDDKVDPAAPPRLADVLESARRRPPSPTPSRPITWRRSACSTTRRCRSSPGWPPTSPRNGEPLIADSPPTREEVRFPQAGTAGAGSRPLPKLFTGPAAASSVALRHEPKTSRASWRRSSPTGSPTAIGRPSSPRDRLPLRAVRRTRRPSGEAPRPGPGRGGARAGGGPPRPLALVRHREATLRAQTRQAQLVVAIAEQLYLSERGRMPATPRDLVGTYLKEIPEGYVDPLQSEDADPSLLRRR